MNIQTQQNIYNFLKLIPANRVLTYKKLAEIFGLHPRSIARILSVNKDIDNYPCYKVINNDGSLGGYNQGLEQKKHRLIQDKIIIHNHKIAKQYFWEPKLKNFFVGFPLSDSEIHKMQDLQDNIKNKFSTEFLIFQNPMSAHITFRFFGGLQLKVFHKFVNKTIKSIDKIKISLKNTIVSLNEFDNFHKKVYFYTTSSQSFILQFQDFYNKYHKLIGLPTESRTYHSHLTVFKVKKQDDNLDKIISIAKKYKFDMKINKLRFYAAVDNYYQIPIIDIPLINT